MNCPKCKSPITESFDPDSIVECPGCGARLMTRAAALKSQGGKSKQAKPPPDPDLTPPVTMAPATPLPMDLGTEEPLSNGPGAAPGANSPPSAENPPVPEAPAPAMGAERSGGPATLDTVLGELRALRTTQEQILELLRSGGARSEVEADPEGAESPAFQPVRSRRRKTVLLIDDDPETREAAETELKQADVPVRTVTDGHAALAAIAKEKPDVIALELGLPGEMAGKDLINMIKATMEWVDIPVILWTREPVATQKEAREDHGADEIVNKSGGPAALVTRVITVFRSR